MLALAVALLLTSCSARVAASLLARNQPAVGEGGGGSDLAFVRGRPGLGNELTYVLRIAASHATLLVVLLLLARAFADSGTTRSLTCAYLCVATGLLGAAIWGIPFIVSKGGADDGHAPLADAGRRAGTSAAGFVLLQRSALLASLVTLAAAAALLAQPQPVIG